MDITTRDIWIYREARSGGTGFSKFMATKLNRQFFCIDDKQYRIDNDTVLWEDIPSNQLMLNTHFPKTLADLHLYNNPFVFRCIRRNLCEQFLSLQLKEFVGSGFHNFEKFTDSPNTMGFYKFIATNKVTIAKSVVQEYMDIQKENQALWEKYTVGYQTYTMFYEDFDAPFSIPELNLHNVQVESHTSKLPDYKKRVFTNYDEVEAWIAEMA